MNKKCNKCGCIENKEINTELYKYKNKIYCSECLTQKLLDDEVIEEETFTQYVMGNVIVGDEDEGVDFSNIFTEDIVKL